MPMQLEKVYEPQRFEPHWAQWWIDSGIYHVDVKSAQGRPVFSIVIPPPNVTGSLHIGHMLDHTIMDVAVRWHRMKGEVTLWVPGTDHAGIATQMVVERQLAAEGVTRQQLGREEFERRVWLWKDEYGSRINNQIRREGASVDWRRERFTMDPGLSRAVRETFVRLWEKGLIYRGEYMVNWCPRCQTAISDVETAHESTDGELWYVRYSVSGSDESLVVATTRPETMLGDTAVIVNPDDQRYTHLHGKSVVLPLVGREIPILADPLADPKFGTGVVKVTPAHDPNDFEAGKRHGLPSIKVIGEDARMTAAAGSYAALSRFEARKRIIAALDASAQLVKVEPYTLNLSKCDRCKTIIEPLVSTQWFVRMKPLAEKAMDAVNSGRIRFVPDDREVVFFQWMQNIRDWCISRQLWWGHRIPAWHCRNCAQITVGRETPAVCPYCLSTELEQDSDVLDTWFSSGLWPFSTLGWPEETEDFKTFYPTSLLITGFDILFFWVSRMIMLGIECTGDVPFREVHMHGLVRDAERQKMSKTKGNVIDPLDIIDRYGTDALRVALLISAATGADIALKEDRISAGRNFANKIWNASRFLFMNMERSAVHGWSPSASTALAAPGIEDNWIFERFDYAAATVNRAIGQHRYHEAAQTLWDFIWGDFCDWYLEVKKLRFEEGSGINDHWRATLNIYEATLRLLHPFMPFLTEELWQRLMQNTSERSQQPRSISLACYPATIIPDEGNKAAGQFNLFQEIVRAARELRTDHKLDPKAILPATLSIRTGAFKPDDLSALAALARLEWRPPTGDATSDILRSTADFDLRILQSGGSQNGSGTIESRERIRKEIARLEKAIASTQSQLSDATFTSKAPEAVVSKMRVKLGEYEEQLKRNQDLLEGLA
ncbi:MAG: valine--tRNA ligase [Acidobacteriaceae bacterium]|nr:valine--tRNA ligase [Acidobacteriaceae bacterium]